MRPALLDPLTFLYGEAAGRGTLERLLAILDRHRSRLSSSVRPTPAPVEGMKGPEDLSERDSILITYGDQVQSAPAAPLQVLANFCDRNLAGLVSGIHLLPFYPWTSDDGFSVTDYRAVDPALGDWADVARVGRNFRLMFDGVINHVSSQSEWFRGFLSDDPKRRSFFIVVDGAPDLTRVVRPRALPLLTKYKTPSGDKAVWTTFSEDQIDLNYRNPDVLLEIVDTLLFYVGHGAEFIRLDAVAYLWKEIGTSCIHLPQTHRVIEFIRAVLDEVAPHVMLITETNVPHADNISYFGDGYNEAQLVYNFALPPLTLHTLRTGSARVLSGWAASLGLPSHRTTFFNFLASHDGIGLNPVRGLLSHSDIDALVQQTLDHGGLVSHKHNPDGSQSPYELNINYFDALSNPNGGESMTLQVSRFMAAQAILLALTGVPGIYFHSLFGSRGWPEGVRQTGRSRSINRQKFSLDELERELADMASRRHEVFSRYSQLLKARAASPAFHPHGSHQVLDCGDALFALLRTSPDSRARVLCLQNVSNRAQAAALHWPEIFGAAPGTVRDVIAGGRFNLDRQDPLRLQPYQTLWLA